MWFKPLESIKSLGSTTSKAKNLGELHQKRNEHLSQFYTTKQIVQYIWELLGPTITKANSKYNRRLSLFDNSCGKGSMFQLASPELFTLYGYDAHEPSVRALESALEATNFHFDLKVTNLEEASVGGFDIGLINPPYSIHLEHPNIKDYPTNSYGKYGASTSAISHKYALEQALETCQVVVAVLPKSMVCDIKSTHWAKRCKAIVSIGNKAFKEECAIVDAVIAIFDSVPCVEPIIECSSEGFTNVSFMPELTIKQVSKAPYIKKSRIVDFSKSITSPVTKNKRVFIGHSGRKIILKFSCGITEAKVLNGIYKEYASRLAPENHRLSSDLRFIGDAKLDIESYLVQNNPLEHFNRFINEIQELGGDPEVCPTLLNYFAKRCKQVKVNNTPLRKWVYKGGKALSMEEAFTGVPKSNYRIYPKKWGSPTLSPNESIRFIPVNGASEALYEGKHNGNTFIVNKQELADNFIVKSSCETGEWVCVHKGLIDTFPQLANYHKAKAEQLGISQWLWDFQLNDVIEGSMRSVGTIFGWHMGTGKTFGAVAMCLMGGKHNLTVLQPHLVEQAIEDIKKLPISESEWQIITCPDDLNDLKTINFITYNKLRSRLNPSAKKTYAHALRNRIHTLNLDEGHVLSNTNTLQTRACWTINAKKVNSFTGTPYPNYGRNIHPQAALIAGDGTAEQPYGLRRSFLSTGHLHSPQYSKRGIDQIAEDFCTFEWVTHQFEDKHETGGKREIPVIKNPMKFRQWVDTFLKRRIKDEPECKQYIQVKDPIIQEPVTISWDDQHLAHYFKVADEFTQWFKKHVGTHGKTNNMMAVLARVNAVVQACNAPSESKYNAFVGLTSKQIAVIDRAKVLFDKGEKFVIYATSPKAIEVMSNELTSRGVKCVNFHGEIPIKKRNDSLRNFKNHSGPMVLLASFGCTETGLNIWFAERILMYNRCWSSKVEEQSIYRLIRPQQQKQVVVERFHLEGSIDEYMHQMCSFKKNCIDVGVDYGEPLGDDVDFLHMDRILNDFTSRIAEARGFTSAHELKDLLKSAA